MKQNTQIIESLRMAATAGYNNVAETVAQMLKEGKPIDPVYMSQVIQFMKHGREDLTAKSAAVRAANDFDRITLEIEQTSKGVK